MNKTTFEMEIKENPFSRLSQIVYTQLKDDIINVALVPGEKISISKIANTLGVSRTPVIEAVKRLCQEDFLVTSDEKSGYYVLETNRDYGENLNLVRKMLDGQAAACCALIYKQIDMEQMWKLAYKWREILTKQNWKEYSMVDPEFHKLLVYSTKNPFLIRMHTSIEDFIVHQNNRTKSRYELADDPRSNATVAEGHIMICKAIETGIPELARQAACAHLDVGLDRSRRRPNYPKY